MTTRTRRPIRILIADDHRLFRHSLGQICRLKGGFNIVGEAENGYEAVKQAQRLQPDIILMDISMPGLDGIQATGFITAVNPAVRVIMLTVYRQEEYLLEAIKAGAQGYLLKDVDTPRLIEAIQAVHRGETLLDAQLTARLFDALRHPQ
jgi:NarL family two-component system response regulator LiaR